MPAYAYTKERILMYILCIGVIIAVATYTYKVFTKEGFQTTGSATKPWWLDEALWTPLNRTRFGWTSSTPQNWFKYNSATMTSETPLYDADIAQIALTLNENDPVKARDALKTQSKFIEYVKKSITNGTAPTEVTPINLMEVATTEATRPSNVYYTLWTPLHRVMWGIKDDTYDSIEYDLILKRGDTISSADLQALIEKKRMRSFPATIAQNALNTYANYINIAREKLLDGTAFKKGVSAYFDNSGNLFREYGILTERPINITKDDWLPVIRTMYPIKNLNTTNKAYLNLYIFNIDRSSPLFIPIEKAEFMLSIFKDDPVQARYMYLKEKGYYDKLYEDAVKKQGETSLTTIRTKSCDELRNVFNTLEASKKALRGPIQDLSESAIVAAGAKGENIAFQNKFINQCLGTTDASTDACKRLATQDKKMFDIYAEYDLTNIELFKREIEVQEAIQTVTDTMKLLKCPSIPKVEYSVEKDIGYIDTETLYYKLSELSPYYISPDILRIFSQMLTQNIITSDTDELQDTINNISKRRVNIMSLASPYKQ